MSERDGGGSPPDQPASSSEGDLAQHVEALWRQGMRPDVRAILQGRLGLTPAGIVEILRVDQRQRWHAGEPIPVSSYLEMFPQLEIDPDVAVDLIWSEYLVRKELGDPPSLEEYVRAYPPYESRLRRQDEVHRWVERVDDSRTFAIEDLELGEGVPWHRDPAGLRSTQDPGSPSLDFDVASFRLPGFEILGEIGRGGMGAVYKARQLRLGRDVALKVLPPALAADRVRLHRFHNEAAIAASLKDSRILPVYDILEAEGVPVIVMPLVEGCDLAQILEDRRAVARGESPEGRHPSSQQGDRDYLGYLLGLLDQVIRAVAVIHEAGIIHRDIKPSNILVDRNGNVQLTDFGLARLGTVPGITVPGSGLGTPGYMSPEQWEGEADVDERADVFSLGATLYHAVTGELPYGRGRVAPDRAPPRRPPVRWPWPTVHLDSVILRALEADRAGRYRSAAEFQADWDRARGGQVPLARRGGWARRFFLTIRRDPGKAVRLVAALSLMTIAAAAARSILVPTTPELAGRVARQRTGPAALDPSILRSVRLETRPAGARIALVPLDADTGLAHPERMVQTDQAGEVFRIPPGEYFIEARWSDGRFHQVYRRVPEPGRNRPAQSHRHERWKEVDGVMVLSDVERPPEDIEAGMVRFEAGAVSLWAEGTPFKPRETLRTVPAFLLDPTEVTIGQFRRVYGGIPHTLARRGPADEEPVSEIPFDWAVYYAETVGKRLPDEWEYVCAATANGSRRYPWGDDPAPVRDRSWAFGPVRTTSPFDRTGGPRPVFNLCSNVAEWTVSWITADPNVTREVFPDDFNFRNERVVRGGPFSVVERKSAGNDVEERDPRWRHSISRYRGHPGLGFRCARSVRPIFLR